MGKVRSAPLSVLGGPGGREPHKRRMLCMKRFGAEGRGPNHNGNGVAQLCEQGLNRDPNKDVGRRNMWCPEP